MRTPSKLVFALLVAGLGCSYDPKPKSGVQQCGTGKPACVDGYVCGPGNLCYAKDSLPDAGVASDGPASSVEAGTDLGVLDAPQIIDMRGADAPQLLDMAPDSPLGGSGGAAGSAGAGGAAGSAGTGGAAGSAGTGGAAGSAGKGGAAGSAGTGGAAGSAGKGGAAGSAGTGGAAGSAGTGGAAGSAGTGGAAGSAGTGGAAGSAGTGGAAGSAGTGGAAGSAGTGGAAGSAGAGGAAGSAGAGGAAGAAGTGGAAGSAGAGGAAGSAGAGGAAGSAGTGGAAGSAGTGGSDGDCQLAGATNQVLNEVFSTDVFATKAWSRSDGSVGVTGGSAVIAGDGDYDDYAEVSLGTYLPLMLEARLRNVSGGQGTLIPVLETRDATHGPITISYSNQPQLNWQGWIFGTERPNQVLTPAPREGEWLTVRAIMRPTGGVLCAKTDTDAGFTVVARTAWTLATPIQSLRYRQNYDAASELDWIRVTNVSPPTTN